MQESQILLVFHNVQLSAYFHHQITVYQLYPLQPRKGHLHLLVQQHLSVYGAVSVQLIIYQRHLRCSPPLSNLLLRPP